ncbi:MAG: mechanosensitive ion channel [Acidobacteriia bacterium]|nr:mechanosensitive ion channel [Methyloceanibacter sp.]MCL6492448.1 mechanosensitive ion channel [Terriglobia bacterium]
MIRPLLLFLVLAVAPIGPLYAQTPATDPAPPQSQPQPALSRAEIEQVLHVLQDPAERAKLIAALQVLAKTPVVAGPPAPAPAPAHPAEAPKLPIPLTPHSLGADLLQTLAQRTAGTFTAAIRAAQSLTNFSAFWQFLRETAEQPLARERVLRVSARLLLIAGLGLALEAVVRRSVRQARARIVAMAPPIPEEAKEEEEEEKEEKEETEETAGKTEEQAKERATSQFTRGETPEASEVESHRRLLRLRILVQRLPFALAYFVLELIPIAAFAAVGYGALSAMDFGFTTQSAILAAVNAYVSCRVVLSLSRTLLAPTLPQLRLLWISDATASYLMRWMRRATLVGIPGYALTETLLLLGLPYTAHEALLKLVVLVLHLFAITMVFQKRRRIAAWLRGREADQGPLGVLRSRLASVWHLIATVGIFSLWLVWALAVPNGYMRLLRVFAGTLVVLLGGRILTSMVVTAVEQRIQLQEDMAQRLPWLAERIPHYRRPVRFLVSLVISALALFVLLESWGFDVLAWFQRDTLGVRLLSAMQTIILISLSAWVIWEGVNLLIYRRLHMLTRQGYAARAARVRTLMPMIRFALLGVLLLFAGPTALSEIGVNIAPLLAGAGIVGVAVGFGSQKLVQDFITGIFLLLENAMQVGDWVTVAGVSGTVEALSVRTIRLRAADGSVHIIPFSAVTTVNNVNRGLGNAQVSVTVSAREDTDRVSEALREIAAELRRDPNFRSGILSDLQLWGVDSVTASTVTIAGQIVCTDASRWAVQREFNRRLKKRFEELGIALANPTQTVRVEVGPGIPLLGTDQEPPVAGTPTSARGAASRPPRPTPEEIGSGNRRTA